MGAMQRRKGASGEREIASLLGQYLGAEVVRNLEQTRSGGHDLLGIEPFALEVKRCERVTIPVWWRQACEQIGPDQVPVVAYRQSRKPWVFILPLRFVIDQEIPESMYPTCEMGIEGFCLLAREIIADAA
ncbi:putative PDDEXK endonuclease [Spiribacter onubensis]|uniref:Holliday junction resolvase n=1 Tax=Spiribacter onubensis TaxID=3122420 RepID=A0ABV3S6U5_9GAMM